MNAEQDPQHIKSNGPSPETPEQIPNQRFWQTYRTPIFISVIILVLVAMTALFAWHTKSNSTRNSSANTEMTSVSERSVQSTNTWESTVDPKALPLGDGKISTSPQAGYVYSCTNKFRGGGARHAGNWINDSAGTWNSEAKISVLGSVDWPSAAYSAAITGDSRTITTYDLPQKDPTGIFPIARRDPAYQFDTNPNHIVSQDFTLTLPANPAAAKSPSCVGLSYIGVLNNGVLLYNALDDAGRDAVAHETQDSCSGHPDGQERYHYHDIPSCIRDRSTNSSTLVGYALDGYGIYVERDEKGNLPTNADLDSCHGRTSTVEWNGKQTVVYHYSSTLEYPYTVGCFHGEPISIRP